jgi:hypothetical protein
MSCCAAPVIKNDSNEKVLLFSLSLKSAQKIVALTITLPDEESTRHFVHTKVRAHFFGPAT